MKSAAVWLSIAGAAFGIGGGDERQDQNKRSWKEEEIPARAVVEHITELTSIERARQMVLEAHWDDFLKNHEDELKHGVGEADGKLALGDYLMLLNGGDLRDFIKANGYAGFRGPVEIRETGGRALVVGVRITGLNRKTMVALLQADGSRQGGG